MSYYGTEKANSWYQPPPAGTPGWQLAPVPGWGVNPFRAGPRRLATEPTTGDRPIPPGSVLPDWTPVATNGALGSEEDEKVGQIALAGAGGIFFGWFLAWAWMKQQQKKRKRA